MLKPVLPYRFLSYWFAKSTFLCSQFSLAVQWSVLSYFLTAGCFKILCKGILEIFCFMQIICFITIRYITRSACDTGAFVFQEILMGTTLSSFRIPPCRFLIWHTQNFESYRPHHFSIRLHSRSHGNPEKGCNRGRTQSPPNSPRGECKNPSSFKGILDLRFDRLGRRDN